MEDKNFKNWIYFETAWEEVLLQRKSGKGFLTIPEMVAVFRSSYDQIEKRFIDYFNEYRIIPHDYFKDQINNFRLTFPKHGRIEDINYYDDLLELLIERYSSRPKGNEHLLKIPTNADQNEILDFWLKLTGNNEKGEPYWESEKEIEHFVYQNFDVFPGVDEIKTFNPNMNKSEFYHVTWTFFRKHGMSKTKRQYEKLLMQNFKKFEGDGNVYSNIKDQLNEHLKNLFK